MPNDNVEDLIVKSGADIPDNLDRVVAGIGDGDVIFRHGL